MTPFSNFHRTANEAAASKRDEARAISERATALLEDLDGLLSPAPVADERVPARHRRRPR